MVRKEDRADRTLSEDQTGERKKSKQDKDHVTPLKVLQRQPGGWGG